MCFALIAAVGCGSAGTVVTRLPAAPPGGRHTVQIEFSDAISGCEIVLDGSAVAAIRDPADVVVIHGVSSGRHQIDGCGARAELSVSQRVQRVRIQVRSRAARRRSWLFGSLGVAIVVVAIVLGLPVDFKS